MKNFLRGIGATLDDTDVSILRILQTDARVSNAEIGRRINLAPSAVLQRIRRLEQRGIIDAYVTKLDPAALGFQLTAFVMIRTGEGACASEISSELANIPEIQEIHRVVGEDCFFTKVRVPDAASLANLLDVSIRGIRGVATTRTTIVLNSAKETFHLPLPEDVPNVESSSKTTLDKRSVV